MGLWRILGNVATGVAVAVALPVAGPVGAVTATGALVAGGVGAAAGAMASRRDGKRRAREFEAGEEHERARTRIEVEKLRHGLAEAKKRLKTDQEHFTFLIALFAVGMAVANADGHISAEEEREIREFVAGVAELNLPPHVKGQITRLRNQPPSFSTAMRYVAKCDGKSLGVFDDVIEVAISADGVEHERETAVREAWRSHRAAA